MARAPVTSTRRWKLPSFEMSAFALIFLGLPLAIYVIFVISPFVQAFYYSMTDWTGFSKKMNFVGLTNYLTLLQDPVFTKAVMNSIVLVLVLPPLVIILSSGVGALLGIAMILLLGRDRAQPMPFGPYLAIAGFIALLWGTPLLDGPLRLFRFD